MAEISIPNLNDGDDASAADINSRFALVAATVNDLSSDNLGTNSITTDKIAPEAVTVDKINWDGQGIIFHQTFGAGSNGITTGAPFNGLPTMTLPMKSGYRYRAVVQARQVGASYGGNITVNIVIRDQDNAVLGGGSVAFQPDKRWQDPTLYSEGIFTSTTTGNVSLKNTIECNSENTSGTISWTGGWAYVECLGKL